MIEQIREYLGREPFEPFRILTTSGDRYEVLDPHAVALAQTYLFYCFPRSDKSAHIRLNQVVAMETFQPSGQ